MSVIQGEVRASRRQAQHSTSSLSSLGSDERLQFHGITHLRLPGSTTFLKTDSFISIFCLMPKEGVLDILFYHVFSTNTWCLWQNWKGRKCEGFHILWRTQHLWSIIKSPWSLGHCCCHFHHADVHWKRMAQEDPGNCKGRFLTDSGTSGVSLVLEVDVGRLS